MTSPPPTQGKGAAKTATAPLSRNRTHQAPHCPHGRGPSSTRDTGTPANPLDSRLPGPPPRRPDSTPPAMKREAERELLRQIGRPATPTVTGSTTPGPRNVELEEGPGPLSRPQIEAARQPHNPSVPGREPPRAPPSRRSPPATAAIAAPGDEPLQRSRSAPSNRGVESGRPRRQPRRRAAAAAATGATCPRSHHAAARAAAPPRPAMQRRAPPAAAPASLRPCEGKEEPRRRRRRPGF